MANIYSLQLLRNGQIFTSYTAAKDAILTSTTQDGVIKLARYTDSTATSGDSKYRTSTVKTIFGIYADFAGGSGWTIYDSYYEIIKNLQDQIDSMTGGAGSIAQQIEAALDQLAFTGATGNVITQVTQEDGLVEATGANVGTLELTGYVQGSDTDDVAATDTINQAFAKLQNQIDELSGSTDDAIEALDGSITADTGYYINKVDEVDGKISGTTAALPSAGPFGEAGKPITGVSETLGEVSASAGTISAQYVDVADADGNLTATNVEAALAEIHSGYVAGDEAIVGGASDSANTLAKLETVVNNLSADAKEYEIEKITSGLSTNVKEAYKLVDAAGAQSGATIEIPKDSSLIAVYLGSSADTVDADTGVITSGAGSDSQSMNFVNQLADGTYTMTKVDVSKFLAEAEFASGVTANANGVVTGVVSPNSESFLTVGDDGFKLAGVQDAINTAIQALDYSGITTSDAAVVTNVTEADGVVAATAANVGGLKLTGYQQGSNDADVAATDTINEAFAKLQNQIAAAEETAQGAHSKVEKDANAAHLTLTSTTDASGATVYTIGETNIANADDLETVSGKVDDAQAEIDDIEEAIGLDTDGSFTPDAANAYTSGATSVVDAIDKLDDAAKANADAIARANQDAITGITVNGSGVTVTDNVAALSATYNNTAASDDTNGMVITTDTNGGLTFQFGTLDAGTY